MLKTSILGKLSRLARDKRGVSAVEFALLAPVMIGLYFGCAIVSPYDATKLKMTITCIKIDANKVATVKWSVTRNGTANSGTMTVPTALAVANSTLILSEASYAYTPTVGYTISGTLTLSDKMYMTPRISAPTYGTTTCT